MASFISNMRSVQPLYFTTLENIKETDGNIQKLKAHVNDLSNLSVTIKKIEEVVGSLKSALDSFALLEGYPSIIISANIAKLIKEFNSKIAEANSKLSGSSITSSTLTATTSTSLKEIQTKTTEAEKTFSCIVRLQAAKQKLLKIVRISKAVLEDYSKTNKKDEEKIKLTAGIVVQNEKDALSRLTMTYLPNRSAITGIPEFLPLIEFYIPVVANIPPLQKRLVSMKLSGNHAFFLNTRFIAAIRYNPVRKHGVLKIQEFDSDHAKCLNECIPKMPPEMINLIGHYWAPNETFIYLDEYLDAMYPMYPFCPREVTTSEAVIILTEKVDIPKTFPDVDILDCAYNTFGIVLRGMHKKTNEAVVLWAAPGSAEFKMFPATVSRETTITSDSLIRMTSMSGQYVINGSHAMTLSVPLLILKVPNHPVLKMIAEADLLKTFPNIEILEGAENGYGIVFLGTEKETQRSIILWAPAHSSSFRAFPAVPTMDNGSVTANGLIKYQYVRINDCPANSLDLVALGLRTNNSEDVSYDSELPELIK